MEKNRQWQLRIRSNILTLLLVLLIVSLTLNVYLYYSMIVPLEEQNHKQPPVAGWRQEIQGGMGHIEFSISRGFTPGPGTEFNVSVWVELWEPYIGSETYNFFFKIFERSEQSEGYPDTPVVEKTVNVHKGKDAMYIFANSGNMTIIAPSYRGIYIYKICFGTETEDYIIEFPIVVRYTI